VRADDDARCATVLLGGADALRRTIGAPMRSEEKVARAKVVDATSAELGTTAFNIAWQDGRSMSVDSLVASAMGSMGNGFSRTE
jgi:hypothetical protein